MVKTGAASRPRLGQHFLRDAGVRDRVLAAVPADGLPLLEVGPGDGALTEALASLGRPLVAVELDEGLAALLQRRLRGCDRCVVLHEDVLDIDAREALATVGAAPPYGVVGNLPYAITAPLLRRFLSEEEAPPRWLLVMVQREVAEQVAAPAGRRSLLSVSVQYFAEPSLLFRVPPAAFQPPPRVQSAVLWIERRAAPAVAVPSEALFFEVVRAGFRAPRKQLHNALTQRLALPPGAAKRWLAACDIDPVRRAATLTLEEWAALAWERERAGAALGVGETAL